MLTTLILETALKKHNFTSNYADYADFRGYIKSNFTSDYVDYANFKDSIKKKKDFACNYAVLRDYTKFHH